MFRSCANLSFAFVAFKSSLLREFPKKSKINLSVEKSPNHYKIGVTFSPDLEDRFDSRYLKIKMFSTTVASIATSIGLFPV